MKTSLATLQPQADPQLRRSLRKENQNGRLRSLGRKNFGQQQIGFNQTLPLSTSIRFARCFEPLNFAIPHASILLGMRLFGLK
jgi:hypothetical protein